MKLTEKEIVHRSLFTWDFIANSILGKHVRKQVQTSANIERKLNTRIIYDRPISSWCNPETAPPVATSKAGGANT